MFVFCFYVLPACRKEKVPEPYKPSNAHRAYVFSLEQSGLADTALGRDWISASKKALQAPIVISLPFEEVFFMDPAVPNAVAYGFDVKKGQKIDVEAAIQSIKQGRIFIDLFRTTGSSRNEWISVASANKDDNRLAFEARSESRYFLRLQPELLRGGECRLAIRVVPSLGFPVKGYDESAILSGFGEPRDGGLRRHHGVDIFAPRHTPVLAPIRAYVRRVGESERGGRHVWLHDSRRSLYLYFAHLETQEAVEHTYVNQGQVIGTVGNTGNARTTPPHLHFAIYFSGEGPVDPHYFIASTNPVPEPVTVDLASLGKWIRVKKRKIPLMSTPEKNQNSTTFLDLHTPMRVVGAVKEMYRIFLPNGESGYVRADDVETMEQNIILEKASCIRALKTLPATQAPAREYINAGEKFAILARFGTYWFVRTQMGNRGWLEDFSTSQ
ncbi:MAG: M23 family metallopeptidase [Candidatus Aminicenantes bacterium]|nr:M23 family metallopeptidase [Candidatus Aminicenantes bacterium]